MSEPPLDPSLFPVATSCTYLNTATICAPPTPVVAAADAFNRDASERGGLGFLERVAGVRTVRDRLAEVLAARAEDVAFAKNTTEALAWVARGLSLAAGDRVIVGSHDFPSTRYPFEELRRVGVVVDHVDPVGETGGIPLERWEEALAAAPARLVVTGWVQSPRGHRADLAALTDLCHRHGALVCVDAIQGVGVVPCRLAEWGVDFAAGGSHKWLLSPEGLGWLYVADPHHELLTPVAPGWRWMGDDAGEGAYARQTSGLRRLEGGTLNGAGLAAMGAALDLLLEAGIDSVWRHVRHLTDRLVEEVPTAVVSDRSPEHASAIVALTPPNGDADATVAALDAGGIAVSARTGMVRVSPHGWNSDADVDRFVAAWRSL